MRHRFVSYGAPLFILVIGGSLGLKHFQQVRFDYRSSQKLDREEARKLGIKVKDLSEVTLDSEYEKIANMSIDDWENKRGPRPWEEDNPLYKEAINRAEGLKEGNISSNSITRR